MVVEYAAGSQGSCMSFFTITPFIILKYTGSAIPLVFPQCVLGVILSIVAHELEKEGKNPFSDIEAPVVLGILVTFLLVFKTQNSYGQFWEALTTIHNVLQTSRSMALTCCTIFEWNLDSDVDREVKTRARRMMRHLVLHFFIIVEFFQRTGSNAILDTAVQDQLRRDIRHLTGDHEFLMLYPDEATDVPGSESKHHVANPTQALFWIQLALGRVAHKGGVSPPVVNGFVLQIQALMKDFATMNKIDKTQFPLPYAQIVKILMIIWVFTLPFFLVKDAGIWTSVIVVLACIGFFGLDEVAEILENPFGNDPNDIFLREFGVSLMSDIQMMCNGRDTKFDEILHNNQDVDFQQLLGGQFKPPKKPKTFQEHLHSRSPFGHHTHHPDHPENPDRNQGDGDISRTKSATSMGIGCMASLESAPPQKQATPVARTQTDEVMNSVFPSAASGSTPVKDQVAAGAGEGAPEGVAAAGSPSRSVWKEHQPANSTPNTVLSIDGGSQMLVV